MVSFIDEHREEHGVEPICDVLPIAPSTYYAQKQKQREPERRSARAQRDEQLCIEIMRGWHQNQEGIRVGRCRVERLMLQLGLTGAVRGGRFKLTTIPDGAAARPLGLVERNFTAGRPNQLWVSDLTYVATWRGFVYVAFVIDVY